MLKTYAHYYTSTRNAKMQIQIERTNEIYGKVNSGTIQNQIQRKKQSNIAMNVKNHDEQIKKTKWEKWKK